MEIELVEDPRRVAMRADAFLSHETISANVISVVLARTLDGSLSPTAEDRWILTVDGNDVVGVAMLNSPYNLFTSRQPAAACALLAETLHGVGCTLPGVTGEVTTCEAIVGRWCELTGCSAELQIAHQVYGLASLATLAVPHGVSGTARLAAERDRTLLAGWLDAFHAEALPHDPVLDNEQVVDQRTAAEEIWLWENDAHPVAMTACSQPAAGVARIGPVYTPPRERGHGYAAAATAAAARAAFERGADALMLYADRANPTSNGIYQRLGFQLDHEAADYGFHP